MKIGLLTYHNSNNYGAVLQATALKSVLTRFGDVTTLDYQNCNISTQLNLIRFSPNLRGVKRSFHDVSRLIYRYNAISNFKEFINRHLNVSTVVMQVNQKSLDRFNFEACVAGSDQIWNPECQSHPTSLDPSYFFKDVRNIPKFSYASSIGDYRFTPEEKTVVAECLSDFKRISVRESDAAKYLSIIANREVLVVPDPTILLTPKEWYDFERPIVEQDGEFILVYSIHKNILFTPALKKIKDKLNLPIKVIDQSTLKRFRNSNQLRHIGPQHFLSLFRNAKHVVTDSFHGVCFSNIFEKNHTIVLPPKRANRITSLLSILELEVALLFEEIDSILDCKPTHKSNLNLKKFRKEGLDYLRECFKTC